MVADPGWRLFVDWCDAHDRESLPATDDTVTAFLVGCPAADSTTAGRLGAIRRAHVDAGLDPPAATIRGPADRSLWRVGLDWLDVDDALVAVNMRSWDVTASSWPAGFRGRRDAALLAVAAHVPMTRAELVALPAAVMSLVEWPADQVRLQVAGVDVPAHDDPTACPACAVVRWMRTAWIAQERGRPAVREAVLRGRRDRAAGHQCRPADGVETWSRLWQVWPAIDRHGWMTDWRPMSTRAVSAVLAARQSVAALVSEPAHQVAPRFTDEDPPEVVERRVRYAGTSTDELLTRLDEEAAAADEVLRRVTEALRG